MHKAVNDMRAVKKEVAELHKKLDGKAGSAAVLAQGDALVAKIKPIEETLVQVNLTGSEGNLNFPDMLNEEIYAFGAGLEDADTAPTKQEVETYATMHANFEAQLAAWEALKSGDVQAFRTQAKTAAL